MIDATVAVAGTGLVVLVWSSVLRTVFIPRDCSSRAARWSVQILRVVCGAAARRLPGRTARLLLDIYAPASLFVVAIGWLLGIQAGFALLATAADTVADRRGLVRFLTFRLDGAAAGWQVATVVSAVMVTAAFLTHLVRFTEAYGRRERRVVRLSIDLALPADPDHFLVTYVKATSRDRVDDCFAGWARWLADVQHTHLSYPALAYSRPVGPLSWPQAVVIVLDAAALVEAVAPNWTPRQAHTLLRAGSSCVRRLAGQIGVTPPVVPVSLQGREERGFDDTIGLALAVGLAEERDRQEAWATFQELRGRYAPYAAAIDFRLGHGIDR